MSNRTLGLSDALYDYLLSVSLREPEILVELRRETMAMSERSMQIAPEQGQFMALLVRLTGARRILEIGTFTGYSALAMALALPPEGRIVACDVSEAWTAVARRYWRRAGVAERIELRLAPAVETLDALVAQGGGGSFDFAFIDADKGRYLDYYERSLTLLRPGGRSRWTTRCGAAASPISPRPTPTPPPSAPSTPPYTTIRASSFPWCRSATA